MTTENINLEEKVNEVMEDEQPNITEEEHDDEVLTENGKKFAIGAGLATLGVAVVATAKGISNKLKKAPKEAKQPKGKLAFRSPFYRKEVEVQQPEQSEPPVQTDEEVSQQKPSKKKGK